MKISMIVGEHFSQQQLTHSHLLCLALLNFEHQVSVVFIGQAFKLIMQDMDSQKHWLALKLYGVDRFYQLVVGINQEKHRTTEPHCEKIDLPTFDALKAEMDLLL